MSNSSFWEKHKDKLFIFGNIYATLCGLMVIDYTIRSTSRKSLKHYLTVLYCHLISFVVIIILPLYFLWNITNLVEAKDRRWQLQLLVNFSNTLIKYCMVVVTYVANFVHYKDIRSITKRRQQLEDNFNRFYSGSDEPRQKFEFMLLFKFSTINAMLFVHIAEILYQYCLNAHPVRIQFQLYTFFLWNYTENMADFFYFINCSALKFTRQLQEQIQEVLNDNRGYAGRQLLQRPAPRNRLGILSQLCCVLSDRLDFVALSYRDIYGLYRDSVRTHQFQILGLILTTLISNLTNLFTIFNLLLKSSITTDKIADIVLNFILAIVFYADTYIVTMISDHIAVEIEKIRKTIKAFAELPSIDWRLEETIENFSFLLKIYRGRFRICGLFYLDRHLTYLTAATGLTYFITLVQFDINWNNLK